VAHQFAPFLGGPRVVVSRLCVLAATGDVGGRPDGALAPMPTGRLHAPPTVNEADTVFECVFDDSYLRAALPRSLAAPLQPVEADDADLERPA
jgi:hypothetical protein